MTAKLLTKVAVIIILSGCASNPDNYDKREFTAVADVTVINLANTKPIDLQKSKPMISLREVCKKYTVDPAKHRDEMLEIAALIGETNSKVHFPRAPEQWQSLSRSIADLIYQDCRAEYLMSHGATKAPIIKLKTISEYNTDDWKN